jgi:galactokinase
MHPKEDKQGVSLFVPGRLCLFGEHCDWAAEYGLHKGFCLVVGTDQGLWAVARPLPDRFVVETQLPDSSGRPRGRARQMTCPWDSAMLLEAARDSQEFFRYSAGVAYEMFSHPGVKGGLDLRITAMDLPLQKGVSSSAAVCILVAKAFDQAYHLGLFPHELMEKAYLGERLTGSQCGRMDQACIYGKTPVLLTFEKTTSRVEPFLPGGEIFMFFADLAGKKDTVRILADLQGAYLRSKDLQRALGEENERILRTAYIALQDGDAQALGKLMTKAQQVFDELVAPHSPEQLASPLLHKVLGTKSIAEHVHGGKGVGSQGDGTAQFVARSALDRDAAIAKIVAAFPQMQCFPLTIVPLGARNRQAPPA